MLFRIGIDNIKLIGIIIKDKLILKARYSDFQIKIYSSAILVLTNHIVVVIGLEQFTFSLIRGGGITLKSEKH